MVQLVLVRPGTTDYDLQGRIQGSLDIPLCEQGGQQVDQLVAELKDLEIRQLVTSPARAAVQTAQALGEALDLKPKTIDQLANLDYGLWQGMLIEDVRHKHPTVYRKWQERPETVEFPQGETLAEARVRVAAALTKLARKQKSGRVVLVVPEPLATLVQSHLTGSALGDLWKAHVRCGSWELLDMPVPVGASHG